MTIWKFPLPVKNVSDGTNWVNEFELQMPSSAEVLSVGVQDDKVMLWAVVDPASLKVARRFRIAATGRDFPFLDGEIRRFIGTVMLYGGDIVLHVFEIQDILSDDELVRLARLGKKS